MNNDRSDKTSLEVRFAAALRETDALRHRREIFELTRAGCLAAADRLLDLPLGTEIEALDLDALRNWSAQTARIRKRTARQIFAALEALCVVSQTRMPEEETLTRLEACLELLESDPLEDPLLLLLTARIHSALSPGGKAADLARKCISMLREDPELDDPVLRAGHLLLFGRSLEFLADVTIEDVEEAERRCQRAHELFARAGEPLGQAASLEIQAHCQAPGKRLEAAALLERAAGLYDRGGDGFSAALALRNAALASCGGDLYGPRTEVSRQAFTRAADLFHESGHEDLGHATRLLAEPPPSPSSCVGFAFSALLLGALLIAFARGADIILVLIIFAATIFIHELGHWLAAALVGIPIRTFRVGLGSRLCFFHVGTTRIEVCMIPFLGYVMPAQTTRSWYIYNRAREEAERSGEKPPDEPTGGLGEEPRSYADFLSRPRRMIFFSGGLAANFVAAVLLLWGWSVGDVSFRTKDAPVLGDVPPASVAEKAGLRRGDEIVSINGEPVTHLARAIVLLTTAATREGTDSIAVEVEREGERLQIAWPVPKRGPHRHWRRSFAGLRPLQTWMILEAHPAVEGRLRPGDQILSATWGTHTFSPQMLHSPSALDWLFSQAGPAPVTLRVRREGEPDADIEVEAASRSRPYYLSGLELEPCIVSVREGSPAWKAGLRSGDRVVTVDGEEVTEYFELTRRLAASAAVGETVLEVERGRGKHVVELPPELFRVDQPNRGVMEGISDSTLEGLTVISVPDTWRDLTAFPVPGNRIENRFLCSPNEIQWRKTGGEILRANLRGGGGDSVPKDEVFEAPFSLEGPKVVLPPEGPHEIAVKMFSFGVRFVVRLPAILAESVKGREFEEERGWIRAVARENWWSLLQIFGVFHCILLFFNFLPIPPLDGFHLSCVLLETVRRRELSGTAKRRLSMFGYVLILLFILLNVFILLRDTMVAIFH